MSNRQIGEMLDISRNTINAYMRLFKACDCRFEELLAMDYAALHKLFTSHTTIKNARFNELMLHFEKVNEGRKHPGFTFLFHYNEYKTQAADAYSYTQIHGAL